MAKTLPEIFETLEWGPAPESRVAADEWLDAHTPDGWLPLPYHADERDRTKPQAEDILALREARELAEGDSALFGPRMAWLVVCNDESDVVVDKFPAILMTVTAPTGMAREIMRRVTL